MTSWREIERIRKDASGFRALATRLLVHTEPDALKEWETEFLTDISVHKPNVVEFTTRQAEKLLEIRENVTLLETVGRGFSAAALIARCYEARLDLNEDDEAWITGLRAAATLAVRRRDAARLLRCARDLGIIDDAEAA
jgi:hypothetical protein